MPQPPTPGIPSVAGGGGSLPSSLNTAERQVIWGGADNKPSQVGGWEGEGEEGDLLFASWILSAACLGSRGDSDYL